MRSSNSDMDADTRAKKRLLWFANLALVLLICTAAVGRDRDIVVKSSPRCIPAPGMFAVRGCGRPPPGHDPSRGIAIFSGNRADPRRYCVNSMPAQ
jgi:hypothetical protein